MTPTRIVASGSILLPYAVEVLDTSGWRRKWREVERFCDLDRAERLASELSKRTYPIHYRGGKPTW